MNVVEFKKGIEENKVKNINKFLADYKEEWGETIEDSIDKLLERYITDGGTDEPFIIDTIKSEIIRETGEWQDINEFEYNNKEMFIGFADYQYQSYFVSINKRKMFRKVEVKVRRFRKRIREAHRDYMYNNADEVAQTYIKEIFKNKEFLVKDTHKNSYVGPFHTYNSAYLSVYWNKEQYDKAEE